MINAPAYCPVCGNTEVAIWSEAKDYEYDSVPETFTYYHCPTCKTIFIHPVPLTRLAEIYPANYYSFTESKRNLVIRIKEWLDRRFFKKILASISTNSVSVLDVGGGTGWIPGLLRKMDARIGFTQIVDIDTTAKTTAEEQGHAYFEGTIEQFETERKFDLILLLNLVEHVADPQAVLEKTAALLAPGGRIVIKTPNTDSWDARLFRKSYWGGLHCPRHWVIFSEKSFRMIATKAGLTVYQLQYTQGAPFWAFSIIARRRRGEHIHRSAKTPIIFDPLFAPLSALFAAFDFIRRPFAKTSQLFILLGKEDVKRN